MSFSLDTPQDLLEILANNAREARLSLNLTQEGLANRSGVNISSLRRFEKTGQISLESLLKIALVLNSLDGFKSLFKQNAKTNLSLDEILKETPQRKRGAKK